MNSDKELENKHNELKKLIVDIVNNGCKFEEIVYLAKRAIKSNYNDIDDLMKKTYDWAKDYENNKITITIDTVTPKKRYIEIIDKIYLQNKLNMQLKKQGV